MTADGILARGKANYKAGKFLNNSETMLYMENLPKEKEQEHPTITEPKPKEENKDVEPNSG